jgi:two-component system, OmpR family, sensor histidine kinase ChvG
MVLDIDSLEAEPPKAEPVELTLKWSRSLSLTARILAVNLFVIAMFAAGLFFLDSFRTQFITERLSAAKIQAGLMIEALEDVPVEKQAAFITEQTWPLRARIRLYDRQGKKLFDSLTRFAPNYIGDLSPQPWDKRAAAALDHGVDFLVDADKLPLFAEPVNDTTAAWPELKRHRNDAPISLARMAPDQTHIISAGVYSEDGQTGLLITQNARDIRLTVRAERSRIGMFFLLVIAISVLLSFFLARTIVLPLRHLAQAAVKVRLGRVREVVVPRLPSRRDEIGMLARALSDMSTALRQRIDATEAFAADVAHEIKNPLASLRSALDGMGNVKDAGLRDQLMAVAQADVLRMDRLISDISEASRVDSQLAKTKFERIDVGDMIEQLLQVREGRNSDGGVKIAFARPRKGVAVVLGEDVRLERVLTNLLDNAVSFSPPSGIVQISATKANDQVLISVSDEGPGIPEHDREAVFRRFHTERPESEDFGEHSGLGLAIARTIIEGHEGRIFVRDRADAGQGACFEIALPHADRPLD